MIDWLQGAWHTALLRIEVTTEYDSAYRKGTIYAQSLHWRIRQIGCKEPDTHTETITQHLHFIDDTGAHILGLHFRRTVHIFTHSTAEVKLRHRRSSHHHLTVPTNNKKNSKSTLQRSFTTWLTEPRDIRIARHKNLDKLYWLTTAFIRTA